MDVGACAAPEVLDLGDPAPEVLDLGDPALLAPLVDLTGRPRLFFEELEPGEAVELTSSVTEPESDGTVELCACV